MTSELSDPVEKLKTALQEVREQRAVFSDDTFSLIIMALLDRIRKLQTTAATTGATTDEIRLVTAMFIDVKDSTQLAREMDTSDFKSVLEEAHRRISSLVAEWDGTVGQYLGDGVLAFFGAQKSQGDDAVRCVACAMAIHAMINSYANRVFLQHGVEFAVRIGISTGRLVVGMVGGSDRQELLALGPATNLAARLQSEAPAGGIYVDAATANRIRGTFSLRSRPMMRIKGFDEPIIMYEVLGRSDTGPFTLAATSVGGLKVPFIGREDVVADIAAEMLAALHNSRFHAVTVQGEIGIGKSRLLQEALEKLDNERMLRVQMVAQYALRAKPYNLLKDYLTKFCQLNDAMSADEVCQQIVQQIVNTWNDPSAADVAALMGYMAGYGFEDNAFVRSSDGSPIAHRHIARYIRGITSEGRQPLVLVIDNVQWADPESIALLNYLLRDLRDYPFLLLAAARNDLGDQHPDYLKDIQPHRRLVLERLSPEITRRLAEAILRPIDRVPAHIIAPIVERADGNPLFVLEFLGMLLDNGVFFKGKDGSWRFNLVLYDSTYRNLPAGLIEVVQSRFDDLSPETRYVLQLAAVTGQTFWRDILEEITGKDQGAVLELLVQRGIITRDSDSHFEGESQYRFRHSLYRDVAYEMLPRAKRENYHRLVARWLTTRIAGKPDYFAILADQFEAGSEHEAALFTYLEAAQNRVTRNLMIDALKLIEKALAMARNVTRDTAIGVSVQLWTLQAQALNSLGRYGEAAASAQSALRLFSEMPASTLTATRVNAARLLGSAYTAMGSYDLAAQSLDQAHNWADNSDAAQMSVVLRAWGLLSLHRGRLKEAQAYEERALVHASTTGQDGHICATRTALGVIALERGDIGQALAHFEFCLERNHANGFTHYQATDLRNLGSVYLALEQHERAAAAFETATQMRDQQAERDTLLMAFSGLYFVQTGRAAEGLPLLKQVVTLEHRDVFTHYQVQLCLIDGHIGAGEYSVARQLAQQLINELQGVNRVLYGRALLRFGRVKHFLGEANAHSVLMQGLEAEREYGGREIWQAHVWVAEATPDAEQRQQHHAQAARALARIGQQLAPKPDLQYAFLHHPTVVRALHLSQ
jgi:class 3 adenylate cyclase/tetratricopeptide (TPR) repeat protein